MIIQTTCFKFKKVGDLLGEAGRQKELLVKSKFGSLMSFDDLFILEVNNFERHLATVAHVRCLGGPMGGHIHSGPRMAMSGDRNSFTLSLESVIHLMHLSHLSHLHIIQESSPAGATSFKDLFTQK